MEAITAAADSIGVSMMTVGIAIAVIVLGAVITFILKSSSQERAMPKVELHPLQMKFMEDKEQEYCMGSDKGKGIRCIIDYMRESNSEHVTEILSEKPKYSDGFAAKDVFSMHLHEGQVDFLAQQGVKIGDGEGPEKFQAVNRAFRCMLDYAMRTEAEGDTEKIKGMFETVRCLNC